MTAQASPTQHILRRPTVTATVAAGASAAIAVLLFAIVPPAGYAWGLTAFLATAGAAVAVVDARTHTLPNRYVAALAAGGLIQAAVVSAASRDGAKFMESLIAAAAVFSAYVLLGLAGWFGFGDAKFAGALAVTVAIYAGLAALYIVPLAILFAALWMLFCRAAGKVTRIRAHGPAIALSAVCIMTAAVLGLSAAQ